MEQTKKIRAFFWPWCFEDKEQALDASSAAGWQLVKGGRFSCVHRQDAAIRYRHHLSRLPGRPGQPEFDAVANACAKNRWELVDTVGGWSYFRKPVDPKLPEAVYQLPDGAEDRVEAYFRKLMKRCIVVIAICCVIAAGFAVWGYIRKLHLWQVAFPFALIIIACFFPYIKLEGWLEKKGRLKPEEPKKKK